MSLAKPHQLKFKVGDSVILRSIGIGQISAQQEMTFGGQVIRCFVIDPPYGQSWYVPTDNADSMIRHPITKAQAAKLIGILRKKGVRPDVRPWRERFPEYNQILQKSNPFEMVEVLRKLYAKEDGLTFDEGRMILMLEDLILGELAIALGVQQEVLEAEMRSLYPGFLRYSSENSAVRHAPRQRVAQRGD